jgi:WD40 repeat protein
VKEVNFFSFAGGVIKAQKGTGWGTKPAESVLCQAFIDNTLVTGAFSGDLHIWNGATISKSVKAHTDGCHALNSRKSKKGIISGGGDGLIIIWGFTNAGLQ